MAYAAASDVAALVRNVLGANASSFTSSTCVTDTQVNVWLSTGCALIEAEIGGLGYSAIPTSSQAYGLAQQINAVYAAWMVERRFTTQTIQAGERTRADLFKKDFTDLLAELKKLPLSRLGVSQTSVAYAGGISSSDKQTVAADGDRTGDRFWRGQFKNPYDLYPVENPSAS